MINLVPTQKDLSKPAIANTIQIKTIDDLQRLAEILSKSGFFEDCKQAAQACMKILAGAELGFPAFSSMCGIFLIKGKPAIGANLMAAIKRSERYDYRVTELSDKICRITFFDCTQEIGISEFSAEDAAKDRNNWQHEEALSKEALIREINSGRSTSNSLKKAISILYERKRRLWSLGYLSALELALSFGNVVTLKSARFSPAV